MAIQRTPPSQPPQGSEPPVVPAGVGGGNWLLWSALLFAFYYLLTVGVAREVPPLPYSEFRTQVVQGRVAAVTLRGQTLSGRYRGADGAVAAQFHTVVPAMEGSRLLEFLEQHEVAIEAVPDTEPVWLQLVLGFLPWLFIIALMVYSTRALRERMGGGGAGAGGLFGFTRSRARRFESSVDGPTYDQVAGCESAKQDLQEIIDYLTDPDKFHKVGANMPKGVLMMGPPGTGKTLLARATAAEAKVPFFSVSGSEFIEMYVGVGAARVRDMFEQARKDAPALIFIDEIDSVGRVRGTGLGGGNDEREQTLNQILAEMDGFAPGEAVVVLAATNRPDVLDPALLRPGRFDRKVVLELPTRKAREAILQVHARNKPLAPDVDLGEVAGSTVGFSGADLENLVNEAALGAARADKSSLEMADFIAAREKVVMGAARENLLNPEERRRVAVHESGHALTAWFTPGADPVKKISIVPHGQALGMTEQLPAEDRYNVEEGFLLARLSILLGGRAAERVVYGSVSSGAQDDLRQATRLARRMVAQWGMSQALGPVSLRMGEEHPFLGREISEPRDFSEATAERVDGEIRRLLLEAEQRAVEHIGRHRAGLDGLVEQLLAREELAEREVEAILGAAQGARESV